MNEEMVAWKKKYEQYTQEIKSKIEKMMQFKTSNVYSYFTYSMHFSHNPAMESMIIGNYHLENMGKEPFHNPYICLKMKGNSILHFSGKYLYKDPSRKINRPGAWERLNESTVKDEFWLRPVGTTVLEPGQSMSFSNFQLKWSPQKDYAETFKGFTYGDGFETGIPSLNQISFSGMNIAGEEDQGG